MKLCVNFTDPFTEKSVKSEFHSHYSRIHGLSFSQWVCFVVSNAHSLEVEIQAAEMKYMSILYQSLRSHPMPFASDTFWQMAWVKQIQNMFCSNRVFQDVEDCVLTVVQECWYFCVHTDTLWHCYISVWSIIRTLVSSPYGLIPPLHLLDFHLLRYAFDQTPVSFTTLLSFYCSPPYYSLTSYPSYFVTLNNSIVLTSEWPPHFYYHYYLVVYN